MSKKVQFDVDDVFNPEDYLYFYHSVLTPERLNAEIDFLIQHTKLNESKKILDLACGHGRHANVLAEHGHHVTGIDVTKRFLEIAKNEAKRLGVEVDYHQDDMRTIHYKESFDRVYVLFTAIGYFDDAQNIKVFQNIYNSLLPGGIFCFDSHNRDAFLTYCLPSTVCERDGNFMVDQHSFDTITGRCSTKRTILRSGNCRTYEYFVRLFNPTEIIQLFNEIGFSSCTFYGGWDGSELKSNSRKMIVVAKK